MNISIPELLKRCGDYSDWTSTDNFLSDQKFLGNAIAETITSEEQTFVSQRERVKLMKALRARTGASLAQCKRAADLLIFDNRVPQSEKHALLCPDNEAFLKALGVEVEQ